MRRFARLPLLLLLVLLAVPGPSALAGKGSGGGDDEDVPTLPLKPPVEPPTVTVPQVPQPPAPGGASNCRSGVQPAGLDPRGVGPRSPNPLVGTTWFVDPDEHAYQAWRRFQRRGEHYRAGLMWKVAGRPRFKWFGRWTRPNMIKKTRTYLDRVACQQPGAVPLMTVMRHQGKGCSKRYGGGGRAEDARSRAWYRNFVEAVGSRRVIIAFEPDSLGTVDCLKRSRRMARLKLLRYGVDQLSRLPNATIYLEGGASDWEPARKTARQLRFIGIRKVRGFMLNVTHYDWTRNNIRHGLRISRLTGGKPFIISTAFNGRGPVHVKQRVGKRRRTLNVWCHPQKRGLGPAPTTRTRHRRVDAYMWIGRPGYSGGSCNGGPLPIGTFWPRRALMLGRWATGWTRPPRGTVNGLFRRYSARALGFCGARCT